MPNGKTNGFVWYVSIDVAKLIRSMHTIAPILMMVMMMLLVHCFTSCASSQQTRFDCVQTKFKVCCNGKCQLINHHTSFFFITILYDSRLFFAQSTIILFKHCTRNVSTTKNREVNNKETREINNKKKH